MVVVVVAKVVNMARFGMAWHGLFFEGEAFDRYPLLDLTDWLIESRAFTLFRSKIKSSMNFYSLLPDLFW